MSQFTLRDAVSSRAFLAFAKSVELRRGGSERRNVFSNIETRQACTHGAIYARNSLGDWSALRNDWDCLEAGQRHQTSAAPR
jgi:hypothetical protein